MRIKLKTLVIEALCRQLLQVPKLRSKTELSALQLLLLSADPQTPLQLPAIQL